MDDGVSDMGFEHLRRLSSWFCGLLICNDDRVYLGSKYKGYPDFSPGLREDRSVF